MAALPPQLPALVGHVLVFAAQKLTARQRELLREELAKLQPTNALGRVPDNAASELAAAKAAIASA